MESWDYPVLLKSSTRVFSREGNTVMSDRVFHQVDTENRLSPQAQWGHSQNRCTEGSRDKLKTTLALETVLTKAHKYDAEEQLHRLHVDLDACVCVCMWSCMYHTLHAFLSAYSIIFSMQMPHKSLLLGTNAEAQEWFNCIQFQVQWCWRFCFVVVLLCCVFIKHLQRLVCMIVETPCDSLNSTPWNSINYCSKAMS